VAVSKFPAADAKVGAKIDFLARQLTERLQPAGFRRRSRVLFRDRGEGVHHCVQLIAFQADKWNAGSSGRFTINLGVCFPALLDLQKDLPGLEWIGQHVNPYDIAFGPGGFEGRLGDALQGERSPRWPAALKPREDFWAEIDEKTDLADLSIRIDAAIEDLALPWLAQHAALTAFGRSDPADFRGPGPRERMLAAILQGDVELARAHLHASPPHRLASDEQQFDALLSLARLHGVDTKDLAWSNPPTAPVQQDRAAKVASLKSGHRALVEEFLKDGSALPGREDRFLDAWLHESAADPLADSVHRFGLWQVLSAATAAQRRALLLRLLQRMPEQGPTVESTLVNVWATHEHYHRGAWSTLARALLDEDDGPCDRSHAAALLDALAVAAHLVNEGMMNDEFSTPLASAIRWLGGHCPPAELFAAKDAVRQLLGTIRDTTRARSRDRLSRMPARALLGDTLADQLASLYTPESIADFDRLYTESPERSFAGSDRDAILRMKRWLRADEAGHVPLQIEADDWGTQLRAAVDELEPGLRTRITSILEWFDASAAGKPAKRWWGDLDARRTALSDIDAVDWLGRTLPRFASTGLKHFLSAPGFLAFPGETAERALLGLVHWAGRIGTPALVPALETVASAAFTVVPGQRMRAYAVGVACLAPLAAHPDGRAALGRLRLAARQKNVKAAIDKALQPA
jgi:hypothetical protein